MAIDLAAWSFGRVLLVSLGWLVALPVLAALYIFLTVVRAQTNTTGAAGIGAVSVGVPIMLLAILWLLPPVALVIAWAVLRFR